MKLSRSRALPPGRQVLPRRWSARSRHQHGNIRWSTPSRRRRTSWSRWKPWRRRFAPSPTGKAGYRPTSAAGASAVAHEEPCLPRLGGALAVVACAEEKPPPRRACPLPQRTNRRPHPGRDSGAFRLRREGHAASAKFEIVESELPRPNAAAIRSGPSSTPSRKRARASRNRSAKW